jgi:hypothetical protein
MILTGKSRPTRRKACLSTTTAIINRTRNDVGSNPWPRGNRLVTIHYSRGTALDLVSVISDVTHNYHRNLNISSSWTRTLNSLCTIQIVVPIGPVNPTGMFPSCHTSSGAGTRGSDVADDKDDSRLPAKRTITITKATFNKMVVV